jgi:hypothetical protein
MDAVVYFRPARKQGLIFHGAAAAALAACSALAFQVAVNQEMGAIFVLLLILSLLLLILMLLLLYRGYALMRANYRLERDGVRLRWGLRAVDIPLSEVEWVRRASDLASDLPKPRLHWPGSLIGNAHTPDLGAIEYMASTTRTMLLIATPAQIYAISPEDPDAFLKAFQRTFEMGSLSPISPISVLPAAYLSRIWADPAARLMLAAGLILALLLFVLVSTAIPAYQTISLGFLSNGQPLPGVPSEQFILLPMIAAVVFFTDLFVGLYFYRNAAHRPVAYLVWGSGTLTMLLFLLAAINILQVS